MRRAKRRALWAGGALQAGTGRPQKGLDGRWASHCHVHCVLVLLLVLLLLVLLLARHAEVDVDLLLERDVVVSCCLLRPLVHKKLISPFLARTQKRKKKESYPASHATAANALLGRRRRPRRRRHSHHGPLFACCRRSGLPRGKKRAQHLFLPPKTKLRPLGRLEKEKIEIKTTPVFLFGCSLFQSYRKERKKRSESNKRWENFSKKNKKKHNEKEPKTKQKTKKKETSEGLQFLKVAIALGELCTTTMEEAMK